MRCAAISNILERLRYHRFIRGLKNQLVQIADEESTVSSAAGYLGKLLDSALRGIKPAVI